MNPDRGIVARTRSMMAPGNPVPHSDFADCSHDEPDLAAFQQIMTAELAGGSTAARPGPPPLASARPHRPSAGSGRWAGSRRWLAPAGAAAAVVAIGLAASLIGPQADQHRPGGPASVPGPRVTGPQTAKIRLLATITVGRTPFGVAVNPGAGFVYVVNTFGSLPNGTVSVIDGKTGKVTGTVVVEAAPHGVAVDPRTGMIFVANEQANDLQGNPRHGTVSVINGRTGAVTATVRVGHGPIGAAANPRTGRVYVTNANGNSVSVISEATSTITATIPVGTEPIGVAVDQVTGMVYVANDVSNSVSVINGTTNEVTATIHVGRGPIAAAVDPPANTVYVANAFGNSVSVINARTNRVVATIKAGHQPQGLAIDPATGILYVAQLHGNSVTLIDTKTRKIIKMINIGLGPQQIAFDTANGRAYVANEMSGTVSVLGP